MTSNDRRAKGLEIASRLLRRRTMDERIPTAMEVVEYAKVLDAYLYGDLVPVVPDESVQVDLSK